MTNNGKVNLRVVVKARDLCRYVMEVTKRCPKQYRFSFVSRLQNLALDVIQNVYTANDIRVSGPDAREKARERLKLQRMARTATRLLCFVTQLAVEQGAMLPKQFEQISKQGDEVIALLGGWISSDEKRYEY